VRRRCIFCEITVSVCKRSHFCPIMLDDLKESERRRDGSFPASQRACINDVQKNNRVKRIALELLRQNYQPCRKQPSVDAGSHKQRGQGQQERH
ncbi:MAG: hypothetical protein OXC07_04780, partial [Kistimonas sp.]|nr:hypothetical protein [Kistimonas sp.]